MPPPAAPVAGPIVHAAIDSIIHPLAAEFIAETLEHADAVGATAAIIELDTPGGLLDATRDISKSILASRTPVVVFVGPRGAQAASAGFFILMSADVAAMAPGTNTGAAHPVSGQGQDIEGDMGAKVEQDAAATIRSLASQRGRDIELAEAAVIESRSFAAEEALENGLVDLMAADVTDLVRQLDGREVRRADGTTSTLTTTGVAVERREMGRLQKLLSVISHPQIALLLISLGGLGLTIELYNPGLIFPGVVGAIALILGFYSMSVLPIRYAGLALIFLALALFVAELFVPTFGILTAGGAIALVFGFIMLFRTEDPALAVDLRLILGMVGSIVLVVSLLLGRAWQVRREPVRTGSEGLVHEVGVARTDLDPDGKIFVHGELWNARADERVPAGAEVEIVSVEGLRLEVRARQRSTPLATPSA